MLSDFTKSAYHCQFARLNDDYLRSHESLSTPTDYYYWLTSCIGAPTAWMDYFSQVLRREVEDFQVFSYADLRDLVLVEFADELGISLVFDIGMTEIGGKFCLVRLVCLSSDLPRTPFHATNDVRGVGRSRIISLPAQLFLSSMKMVCQPRLVRFSLFLMMCCPSHDLSPCKTLDTTTLTDETMYVTFTNGYISRS